ncbi:putative phospholipid hydroperoxide glutathione peroxidase 6 [Citrus sinensis]|uniref:Phospholipid hydroperoxide glutathione peroxidase 6 n=1 Tax=Citrus sinensis TaxID=2711 RepID=A0ACB8LQN7_CITSI|nr:putative phospholipid hydroperoxide glutathione peroxidase 6 [Citrus sinensis]
MYFQVLDSFLHSQWKKIFLNILLISAYPCFAVFFFLFCVSAGLEILAFPCNQFGAQEPGDNEQIQEFACTRFKAEFPIFDKVDVNGDNAAPLYKHLKSSKGGLFGDSIKWNFSKFLVDKEGNVVERYAPTTSPLSIEKDIKKLLETA